MSWFDAQVQLIALAIAVFALGAGRCSAVEAQASAAGPGLRQKSLAVLHGAMKKGHRFEKVHAAEALLWCGQSEGVKEYFLEQDRTASSDSVYRIGVQRVLYRTSVGNQAVQGQCLEGILAAVSDDKAEGRGTAAETLAKLKYATRTPLVLDLAERGKADLRVSARWILANSGGVEDESHLAELLDSKSPKDRFYAAYAFRHFQEIRPATLGSLQNLAAREPADGEVRHYVLGTLYTHLPAGKRESVKGELLRYAASGNTDQRYQSCMALANWPTEDMVPVAESLLGNSPVDERIGGAYLLLKMGRARDKFDPNH